MFEVICSLLQHWSGLYYFTTLSSNTSWWFTVIDRYRSFLTRRNIICPLSISFISYFDLNLEYKSTYNIANKAFGLPLKHFSMSAFVTVLVKYTIFCCFHQPRASMRLKKINMQTIQKICVHPPPTSDLVLILNLKMACRTSLSDFIWPTLNCSFRFVSDRKVYSIFLKHLCATLIKSTNLVKAQPVLFGASWCVCYWKCPNPLIISLQLELKFCSFIFFFCILVPLVMQTISI